MNRIRIGRLIISAMIALIVFFAVEFILEQVIGRYVFAGIIDEWVELSSILNWSAVNYVINILIFLASCIMVMWLYAALRPMFGVGPKTALITGAFVLTFISAYAINESNLGIYPLQVTLVQLFYWVIELPLAVIAGAYFYEAG